MFSDNEIGQRWAIEREKLQGMREGDERFKEGKHGESRGNERGRVRNSDRTYEWSEEQWQNVWVEWETVIKEKGKMD